MTGGERESRPQAAPTEIEELEHMLTTEEGHEHDQSDENIQGSKVGEVVTEAVEDKNNKK